MVENIKNLRRVLYDTCFEERCVYLGNHSRIHGDFCVVYGQGCTVTGFGCLVYGRDCDVTGSLSKYIKDTFDVMRTDFRYRIGRNTYEETAEEHLARANKYVDDIIEQNASRAMRELDEKQNAPESGGAQRPPEDTDTAAAITAMVTDAMAAGDSVHLTDDPSARPLVPEEEGMPEKVADMRWGEATKRRTRALERRAEAERREKEAGRREKEAERIKEELERRNEEIEREAEEIVAARFDLPQVSEGHTRTYSLPDADEGVLRLIPVQMYGGGGGAAVDPPPNPPANPFAAIKDMKAEEAPENDDARTCAICMDNVANVAYQCGHVHCPECAKRFEACPSCRQPVKTCIRLFF